MKRMRGRSAFIAVACIGLAAALGGCASGYTKVASAAPQKYESLGMVTGTGCGSMGILATAYYAVPIGINGRVENA